jgi:putative MATE family efflux protein
VSPDRRELSRALLVIGVPIALQSLVGSSLNMLDSLMIGSLGTARIAGVALANQVFFVLNLFIFGVGSGAGVFMAQYWGGRDVAGIRRSLGASLIVTLAGTAAFFAAAQAAPGAIIALFSSDPEVIEPGAQFLRIVSVGFLFQAVSASWTFALRSTERTRLPLVASAISLAVNTFFNWVLIYGTLGFPALGVVGSGIATAGARFLEMAIIVAGSYRRGRLPGGERAPRPPAAARLRELFSLDLHFLRRFAVVVLPVVGNEAGWALGMAVEAAVFGHMGASAVASFSIADTAIKLVILVFFGVVNASAVIVGKRIGAGDKDGALAAASYYARLAPLSGLGLGAIVAGLSFLVPSLYNVGPGVRWDATLAILIFSANLPLRFFNWEVIVGVLRAGGDTVFSLAMDVGTTWLVGLPLTAIGGLVLGAPFWLVYLLTLTEDLPKAVFGYARMRSRRWLNDLTRHPAA